MSCLRTNVAAVHILGLDLISFIILIKICPFHVDKAYLIYSPITNGRHLSHSQPAIAIWIQNDWGSRKCRTWSLAWEVGQVTRGMFPVWILVLGSCLCHSASCLPCVPAAVVFCFTAAPEWAELRQTDTSETMSKVKPSSLLLGFLRCVVTAMTK